VNISLFEAQVT